MLGCWSCFCLFVFVFCVCEVMDVHFDKNPPQQFASHTPKKRGKELLHDTRTVLRDMCSHRA